MLRFVEGGRLPRSHVTAMPSTTHRAGATPGRHGPRALVTGAGRGLGRAFAVALAERGFDLALVDLDAETLASVRREIAQKGRDAHCAAFDLTDRDALEAYLRDAPSDIGLVIANAGISHLGAFDAVPLDAHRRALALNCDASLTLAHHYAGRFRARGRGGIVLISSNSGVMHSPYVGHYAATKAYLLSLAESMHEELREAGVDVLGYVPGLTDTPALREAGIDAKAAGPLLLDAAVVAQRGLEALGRGPRAVPNVFDRLGARFLLSLPRAIALRLNARTMFDLFPGLQGDHEKQPSQPAERRGR